MPFGSLLYASKQSWTETKVLRSREGCGTAAAASLEKADAQHLDRNTGAAPPAAAKRRACRAEIISDLPIPHALQICRSPSSPRKELSGSNTHRDIGIEPADRAAGPRRWSPSRVDEQTELFFFRESKFSNMTDPPASTRTRTWLYLHPKKTYVARVDLE